MPKLVEVQPKALMWPGEADLRERLLGYSKKYGDANTNLNYLTPQEREALSFLEMYGDQPAGSSRLLSAIQDDLLGGFESGFDPAASPYFAPAVRGIEQRRGEAVARNRRDYQLGGNLSSLARARADADIDTNYEAQIADLMLGLSEREKARAIPTALNLGQYVEESPLRKAEAFRNIGSIPRDLESNAVNVGSGILTNYRPTYYNPLNFQYFKPTQAEKLFSAVGGAAGFAFGGPQGAQAGMQIGNQLGGYFGG